MCALVFSFLILSFPSFLKMRWNKRNCLHFKSCIPLNNGALHLVFGCWESSWVTWFFSSWQRKNFLQRWANLLNDTNFHSKQQPRTIFGENWCHVVNFLSCSSSSLLGWEKSQPNSATLLTQKWIGNAIEFSTWWLLNKGKIRCFHQSRGAILHHIDCKNRAVGAWGSGDRPPPDFGKNRCKSFSFEMPWIKVKTH